MGTGRTRSAGGRASRWWCRSVAYSLLVADDEIDGNAPDAGRRVVIVPVRLDKAGTDWQPVRAAHRAHIAIQREPRLFRNVFGAQVGWGVTVELETRVGQAAWAS